MKNVMISTVLLNWNRKHLLEKTIRSYLKTITVDYELLVVDNASTDGSQELIKSICRGKPNHQAVYLDTNLGGEALNEGIKKAKGKYIHISENDIEYMPGWDIDILAKFNIFPELGQLCPFSPFHQANEGEIWEDHPATPLMRDGVTIYVAHGNVITTSVFRREIWDKGVRWRNYAAENFKFPADGAFSESVKLLGYLVS